MVTEHDKKVANGVAPSHVLLLRKEMWEARATAKDEWEATQQREREQQEDMVAVKENLGPVPDAPQAPDQQQPPPPPPPLNNPPNPLPQTPNRQLAAVQHADANCNHARVNPANASHTRYRPPQVNQHDNIRQHHCNSITPQTAARPRASNTIRANSGLTFDLTDEEEDDAGEPAMQRPQTYQRHLDMIDRIDNGYLQATMLMNRLQRLMERRGGDHLTVSHSQVLNNLGGFMAVTAKIGGSGQRRNQAWAIADNLLNELSRQYGGNNNNN